MFPLAHYFGSTIGWNSYTSCRSSTLLVPCPPIIMHIKEANLSEIDVMLKTKVDTPMLLSYHCPELDVSDLLSDNQANHPLSKSDWFNKMRFLKSCRIDIHVQGVSPSHLKGPKRSKFVLDPKTIDWVSKFQIVVGL